MEASGADRFTGKTEDGGIVVAQLEKDRVFPAKCSRIRGIAMMMSRISQLYGFTIFVIFATTSFT